MNKLYGLQREGRARHVEVEYVPPKWQMENRRYAFERVFTPPDTPLIGYGYSCSGAFHQI